MSTTRRAFLETAAATGAAFGLLPYLGALERVRPAPAPLRILILGGTGFIGPYEVSYALARGHKVTVFNRGRTPGKLTGVEELIGDRAVSNYEALRGKTWDAVIDNSASAAATAQKWCREACAVLKDSTKYYLFVSSTGVYFPYPTKNADESVEPPLEDPPGRERSYGVAKVLSEREVQQAFPNGAIAVRPHFIAGPEDPTDRFTYWPVRMERGGEVMGPGNPTDNVQFIDVRDVTEFMVHLIENGTTGVFNAAGPTVEPLTTEGMLARIEAVTKAKAKITWVTDYDFITEQRPRFSIWMMPRGNSFGYTTVVSKKAVAAGLKYRPIEVTTRDTLAWHKKRVADAQTRIKSGAVPADSTALAALNTLARGALRAGPTPEREAEMLAAWHARKPG